MEMKEVKVNLRQSSKQIGSPWKIYRKALMGRNQSSQIFGQDVEHGDLAPTLVIKPRINKLEHLEAKMASIEVSLSNGLQHQVPKPSGSSNSKIQMPGVDTSGNDKEVKLTQTLNNNVSRLNERLHQFANEIDRLHGCLSEKNAIICALRHKNSHQLDLKTTSTVHVCNVMDERNRPFLGTNIPIYESRLRQLQVLLDNKLSLIKETQMKLDSLEVNDLDSRINQAELECLLEKEELDVLNLQQERCNLRTVLANNQSAGGSSTTTNWNMLCLPPNDWVTIFTIVNGSQDVCCLAVAEVPYDDAAPSFYVTVHSSGKGLFVQWAKDCLKLRKGDRLLEVNGWNVASFDKPDFLWLLRNVSTTINVLKIVVMRKNPILPVRQFTKEKEALMGSMSSLVYKLDTCIKENKDLHHTIQKLKEEVDQHKEENVRLSHRTFYLEDQIAELSMDQSQLDAKATPSDSGRDDGSDKVSEMPTIKSSSIVNSTASNVDTIDADETSADVHHVLQIRIPFSASRQLMHPAAPTCNLYANVPFVTGADNDSGIYCADNLDGAACDASMQQNLHASFSRILHEGAECGVKANYKTLALCAVPCTSCDHGYVNLIEENMRESVTQGTSSVSTANNLNGLQRI